MHIFRSFRSRSAWWVLLSLGLLAACRPAPAPGTYLSFEGQTMGTYYRITYADAGQRDFQPQVEERLRQLNMQVSTYIDSSTISRFNRAADTLLLSPADTHFIRNFEKSREIFEKSGGAFDPTVMPLVNYWGFGYTGNEPVTVVDSGRIDSLLRFVGLGKVELTRSGSAVVMRKSLPGVQLDFSAIAKGYGVDELGRLLAAEGVTDFLIDIGGEVLARGVNSRGEPWNIGISTPREDAPLDDISTAVPLVDQAVATSGNYRNFYEVEGVKYSHEINPRTGFPERNTLLSASVFAADCMTADGYATACMVLGVDAAFDLAGRLPEIEALLIYSDENGLMKLRYTDGLKDVFEKK